MIINIRSSILQTCKVNIVNTYHMHSEFLPKGDSRLRALRIPVMHGAKIKKKKSEGHFFSNGP